MLRLSGTTYATGRTSEGTLLSAGFLGWINVASDVKRVLDMFRAKHTHGLATWSNASGFMWSAEKGEGFLVSLALDDRPKLHDMMFAAIASNRRLIVTVPVHFAREPARQIPYR